MLVVEDNPDSLEMLDLMLRQKGCEVVCVTDGAEALAAVAYSLKAEPFDLAIVDIAMRHVDGLAFLKALYCFQANELFPRPLPVKVHSAYADSYEVVRKGKVRKEDYYEKGDGTLRLMADVEALRCGGLKAS